MTDFVRMALTEACGRYPAQAENMRSEIFYAWLDGEDPDLAERCRAEVLVEARRREAALVKRERAAWARLPRLLELLGFVPDIDAPHRERAPLGDPSPPSYIELAEPGPGCELAHFSENDLARDQIERTQRLTRFDFLVGGRRRYVYAAERPSHERLDRYFRGSQ